MLHRLRAARARGRVVCRHLVADLEAADGARAGMLAASGCVNTRSASRTLQAYRLSRHVGQPPDRACFPNRLRLMILLACVQNVLLLH